MPKRSVRVGGYTRKNELVKSHKRRGTKVKPYTQKRTASKRGM